MLAEYKSTEPLLTPPIVIAAIPSCGPLWLTHVTAVPEKVKLARDAPSIKASRRGRGVQVRQCRGDDLVAVGACVLVSHRRRRGSNGPAWS